MKVYKCVKRFFSTELERYIPVDARIYQWETVAKISIDYGYDLEPVEYDDPELVEWVDTVFEKKNWLILVTTISEQEGGYISSGTGGTGSSLGLQGPQGPVSSVGSQSFSVNVLSGQTETLDSSIQDFTNWILKIVSPSGIQSLRLDALNDQVNSMVHYNIHGNLGYNHDVLFYVNDLLELIVVNNSIDDIQVLGRQENL